MAEELFRLKETSGQRIAPLFEGRQRQIQDNLLLGADGSGGLADLSGLQVRLAFFVGVQKADSLEEIGGLHFLQEGFGRQHDASALALGAAIPVFPEIESLCGKGGGDEFEDG